MIQIGKAIVSEEIIEKDIYPRVKPYLRPQGIAAIEAQGVYTTNKDGEYETPLVNRYRVRLSYL